MRTWIWLAALASGFYIVAVVFVTAVSYGCSTSPDFWDLANKIGGTANVVGPIVLLMAFATLLAQNHQFEKTIELTSQQAFESTFYSMVEHLGDMVEGLTVVESNAATAPSGRALLHLLRADVFDRFTIQDVKPGTPVLERLSMAYEFAHTHRERVLIPFYRLFTTIVEHVTDNAWLNGKDPLESAKLQQKYFQVLRAHLSQDEIFMLMAYLLTEKGTGLRKLMAEHQLAILQDFECHEYGHRENWAKAIAASPIAKLVEDPKPEIL